MRATAFGLVWALMACLCPDGPSLAAADAWLPAQVPLMTRWGKSLSPTNVLPEYPRPQMTRSAWLNLNGLWDYAITRKEEGPPKSYQGKILVPFPIESALSGVHRSLDGNRRLWYRRTVELPAWAGERVLLNFGAVDFEAQVLVNGQEVATHRGGFDSFTLDITEVLTAAGPQDLVVSVLDETGGGQAKGKQSAGNLEALGTLAYSAASGIWQTVWIEIVPPTSIDKLKVTPDVDGHVVRVTAIGRGTTADDSIEAVACEGSREVARAVGKVGAELTLPIPQPKLWSPDDPFLYGLTVSLRHAGRPVDAVGSYFGMRKVTLGKDAAGQVRLLLNNQPVFQIGPLDQGYWPDGIYTAASDEALRYDIEMTKQLGFNTTRKHVKVEPDRWYYWCDRLGLLVWQDMPSGGGHTSPAAARQFETELQAMVKGLVNHPSVVMWVIFNEGWGQYDTERLTHWVKQLDPTRLVDSVSCIAPKGVGDVIDDHPTEQPGADWYQPGFDASAWKEGPAPLGASPRERTVWTTPHVWIRREFEIGSEPLVMPQLIAHHALGAEVYINGILAAKLTGYTIEYQEYEIRPEARASLKPGRNLLAVHVFHDGNQQLIDVGVVDPVPAETTK